MDENKKAEVRRAAITILTPLERDQRKKAISDMFDTWRLMKGKEDPKVVEYLEELQIWDDVYHELKNLDN